MRCFSWGLALVAVQKIEVVPVVEIVDGDMTHADAEFRPESGTGRFVSDAKVACATRRQPRRQRLPLVQRHPVEGRLYKRLFHLA